MTLTTRLVSASGEEAGIATAAHTIAPGTSSEFSQDIIVAGPDLWSLFAIRKTASNLEIEVFWRHAIAVAMAVVGIVGGISAYGVPFLDSIAPVVWGVQNDNLLTSIPLFVLLGELLLRSGIADRMYLALSAWLGRLPGGLLHTNIGSCALFAATSGSSVATAATVGTVALPSLIARGYPMRHSLGSLAAGGTLGILIPPSVNMIVYGSLTNNSIGQLFVAGIVPGLLLTGCFMLWIWVSSVASGKAIREERVPLAQRMRTLQYLVPPLVVFGAVMGSR